ncbi:MAG: hypothetical protein KIT16_24345, partial [Rhodospirillaceae bacterium]|nr:hypothetical protein [Rhodospirillaceae bacterium]
MRSFALAAGVIAIGLAVAVSASAQNSAPGAAPTHTRTNPGTAPPTPPARGFERYNTRIAPPGDLAGTPKKGGPKLVDDIAGGPGPVPGHGGSTCYPAAGPNCVASLDKLCTEHGGG